MTKQHNTSSGTGKDLKKWLKKFEDSWSYAQQNYHERWERNLKLYHNIRTDKQNNSLVSTFVPMVNSSVNTIVAALFNSNPTVSYLPNYHDQEDDTKVLNELYADFARRDNWVQKNKVNGRQGIIVGNFCAFYEWVPDKDGGYVHKINVPIRDMIIDPSSHGYEDWEHVGRRYYASLKGLKSEKIYDFESDKYVKRYKHLDEVSEGSAGSDKETDKEKKDQMLGSTAPDDRDQVELIEIWTRKRVVTIANRQTIIEDRENPHFAMERVMFEQRRIEHELERAEYLQARAAWEAKREMARAQGFEDPGDFPGEEVGEFEEEFDEDNAGLLPFAHGRNYEDISLPYGDSDVDIIADLQELLNNIEELSLEAEMYTVYPEMQIDPRYSSQAQELEHAPGKIFFLPQGALNWLNPPSIPTHMFSERVNIKDEIREAISVSQISKGVTASDTTTATEIKATLGQADNRIQEKAQTMANDFFFQEAKIVLKLIQLYAPDEMWVRNVEDAGAAFTAVNPRKFTGEYTPMVTLDIQRKSDQAQEQKAYIEAFQMMIQDPSNDLQAAKEICYPKIMPNLSQDQIARIIAGGGNMSEGVGATAIPAPQEQASLPEGVSNE